ncbi:hypothetical protein Tco_0114017, partial [Tanacetum coccineum]
SQAPATVKAVEESCVTYGGAHSHRNCPPTDGNIYRDNIQEYVSQATAVNYNQGNTGYRPLMVVNQIRPPGFPLVQQNYGNNQNHYNQNRGNNYNQGPIYQPPVNQALIYRPQVNQPPAYQAPAYQAPAPQTQGTLPSNTITNPKEDLKGITTQSGVAYQGPKIPTTSSSPPKVVERETEVTKDTVPPTNNGSTEDVQPPVVQVETHVPISEPVVAPVVEPFVAPVSALKPNHKPSIPYPSRLNDQKLREKANNQMEKFFQ